jgi:hypothetical protein
MRNTAHDVLLPFGPAHKTASVDLCANQVILIQLLFIVMKPFVEI